MNKADGDSVDLDQAAQYTKSGTINPNDVLGNPYVIGTVGDSQVLISLTTKFALTGVNIDWVPTELLASYRGLIAEKRVACEVLIYQ